jgi:hypothetical protein
LRNSLSFSNASLTRSIDACRAHQAGHGLSVLGNDHFLTLGYSVEKARKMRLGLEGPYRYRHY